MKSVHFRGKLLYSTGIDHASYGNINFMADIWPVQGGEMNALLRHIPVWVAEHPEDITVGSHGSQKEELQFRKGLWTLLIDSSQDIGKFMRPLC